METLKIMNSILRHHFSIREAHIVGVHFIRNKAEELGALHLLKQCRNFGGKFDQNFFTRTL